MRRKNVFAVAMAALSLCSFGAETVKPKDMLFWDHTQPLEKRLDDLMSRLTLDEKVQNIGPNPKGIERLGIGPYCHWNHAAHGINASLGYGNSRSVVYPTPINQSSTFHPELMVRMGKAVGEEGRAKFQARPRMIGGLSFWNPTVNLARDPRWGRTNEAYGEDPYLSGTMSSHYIMGMQGTHPKYFLAIGTPKHFVANNDETTRFFGNSPVPMRALREYYMRPFEMCVKEGKAFSLMSSYNRLNGIPCVANHWLLTDVLRKEWGFKGYAVSDASAVINVMKRHHYAKTPEEAAAMAIKAGTDISIGGGFGCMGRALEQGLVTEDVINRAVRNQFRSRFLLGEFDPAELVPYRSIDKDVIACDEHREVSKQIARESIILMKNENNLLPLNPNKIKSMAIIGRNADVFEFGSYSNQPQNTKDPLTILKGMKKYYGDRFEIYNTIGCSIPGNGKMKSMLPVDDEYASFEGKPGWRGEYFDNDKFEGKPVMVRMDKMIGFNWRKGSPDKKCMPKDRFSVRWTADVVPTASRSVKFDIRTDDGICFKIDENTLLKQNNPFNGSTDIHLNAGQTYRFVFELVEKGGEAKAFLNWDILSPRRVAAEKARVQAEAERDAHGIRQAVALAKKCDVAVVVVGTTGYVEAEGQDRKTIELPGQQNELVEKVCAANPNTVVVLVNGSVVALERIKKVAPAILETFFIGPDQGQAVSEVLMGKVNPSGKLPLTFYKSDAQLPPMADYDLISHGRTYQYFEGDVTYPFGHGLSYTTFAYDKLNLSQDTLSKDGSTTVSFQVTNTGKVAGDEVAQMYIHVMDSAVKMPLKKLVAFKRVSLKAGETKTVTLKLKAQDAAYWEEAIHGWKVQSGRVQLMVGSSSQDIRLRSQVTIR